MTLSIQHLSFERNQRPLFNNINCELQAGECLQIRGANGSGKSTFLRILAGFIEPQQGSVKWRGENIYQSHDGYRHEIHFLGHQSGVKLNLTVWENLKLFCVLTAKAYDKKILQNAIQKVGLQRFADTPASQLSAGQLRRVALARLVLNAKPLWLLDEPLTALDKEGQEVLNNLLKEHLEMGGMVVVATHHPVDLTQHDKIIDLSDATAAVTPPAQNVRDYPRVLKHRGSDLLGLLLIVYYDMLTTLRQAHAWLTPVLFFAIVVCLFPMAVGANTNIMTNIAPGILWVASLLAVLLSVGNIFSRDAQEGFLDILLLSSTPLILIVFCKTLSHWLTHCFPLIVISPVLGILLGLNLHQDNMLMMTLLLGTPVLSLLGAIGAALVTGIRGSGLLLPVLIMPLYIPVLIFGTGTLIAANANLPINGYFAIMGAFILLTIGFSPLLASLALRTGVNQ